MENTSILETLLGIGARKSCLSNTIISITLEKVDFMKAERGKTAHSVWAADDGTFDAVFSH